MSAADLDKVESGLDLDQAMGTLISAIDPNVRGTLGALLSMNEGKDADEVDFATFASFFFAPGTEHEDVMPRGGYRGVVEHLAGGLDIRTEQPVRRITQGPDGVMVETSSETFSGSHVLEKVALAYERAVWQVDGVPGHMTVVDSPRPDWPVILDLSTWYGVPVVVALATGAHGRALAAMSESQRVAALHATICEIGGPDTPEPIAFATTSWATDPFVLGCYANIAPTTDPAQHATDLTTLATPHGRVLFAGEHTCERGTSTVDSAWITGVREASRLLQRGELPL
jgi:monoamine oxidase